MSNIFGEYLGDEEELLTDPLIVEDKKKEQAQGLFTPAEPADINLDDFREGVREERERLNQAQVDGVMQLSIDNDPQQQIRNEQLSGELEQPVERIEMDPKGAETQLKLKQANELLQQSPKLQEFMKQLDIATKLSIPADVENLSWWETVWKDMGDKFDEGRLTREQGLRVFNQDNLNDKQKIENQKRIKDIDNIMEGYHADDDIFGPSGPFGEAALLVGQMVDGLDEIIAKGLAGATGAGTAAAIYGQAGPQAALPEELITVPAASVSGGTISAMAEVFDQARKIEAGHARHEMEKAGFAKDVAKSTADIVGWVNGTLEVVGIGLFTKPIKSAITKAIYKKARLGIVTKRQALGLAFATIFKSAGGEAGTEMIQEVNNFVQREIGRQINNSFEAGDIESQLDTPEKLKEAAKQVGTVGIKVLAGAAVIASPGGGFRYYAERKKVSQADINEKMMLAMGENAQMSELAQQLPDRHREIVEAVTEDGPVSDVFVEADKIEEFYQEGASAVMEEMGLEEQYATARAKSDFVKIPLGTYASKIARNPEAHNAFTPHSKFDIDGFTPTEAQDFMADQEVLESDGPAILKKHAEASKENTAFDNIQTEQRDQLMDAGQTQENAVQGARIMAHNQRAMAHAMGVPLSEYNKMFPVVVESIKNPLITTMEELEAQGIVTDADLAQLLESKGKDGLRIKSEVGDRNTSLTRVKKRLAQRQTQDLNQQAQTLKRTPEFQAFFEGSQVVDEAGDPMVAYHATNTEFSEFKEGATYFSNDPKFADRFAFGEGANIRPVFLNIKNPEIIDGTQEGRHFEWDAEDINMFKKEGKDGIIIRHPDGDVYTTFEPTQIKSIYNESPTAGPDMLNQSAASLKRTPEFQAFFEGSQVVDEAGELKVQYHGTTFEFEQFNTNPENQFGAHFGSSQHANAILDHGADPDFDQIIPVFLDIKNPVRVFDLGDFTDMEMLEEGFGPASNGPFTKAEFAKFESPADVREALEEKGYDGVVYTNTIEGTGEAETPSDADSYIAFSPSQIKSIFNERPTDYMDMLNQSAAPLQKKPLKVEATGKKGQVTNWDIGQAFTDRHEKKYGRKLDPMKSEEDYKLVLKELDKEYKNQATEQDAGADWYIQDINDAVEVTKLIIPELADPHKKNLFLAIVAFTSPNNDPLNNWEVAVQVMQGYIQNGKIPTKRQNPKTKKFTGKNLGVKALRTGTQLLQKLIDQYGEQGAVKWISKTKSGKELAELRRDSKLFTKKKLLSGYVAGETNMSGKWFGAAAMGPKVSEFFLNVAGLNQNALTIDLWAARTYNRHIGRLLDVPAGDKKAKKIVSNLRGKAERDVIKRLFTDLAKKNNVEPSAMQAALWYFEQRLFRNHGATAKSENFSSGALRAAKTRKITVPGRSEDGGPAVRPEGGQLQEVFQSQTDQTRVTPNWYYSQLAESFNALPDKKTQPQSTKGWKQVIKKLGIKNQELEWTGIFEWLDTQTKEQQVNDLEEAVQRRKERLESALADRPASAFGRKNIAPFIATRQEDLEDLEAQLATAKAGKGPKITKSEISNFLFNNDVKVETVEVDSRIGRIEPMGDNEFDMRVFEVHERMLAQEVEARLNILVQDEIFRLSKKDADGNSIVGEPIEVTRKRIEDENRPEIEENVWDPEGVPVGLRDDDIRDRAIDQVTIERVERDAGDESEIGADLAPYTFKGGTDESSLLLKIEQEHPQERGLLEVAQKVKAHADYVESGGEPVGARINPYIERPAGVGGIAYFREFLMYDTWEEYVTDKQLSGLPRHGDAKNVLTEAEAKIWNSSKELLMKRIQRFTISPPAFGSHVFPEHGNIVTWIRKQTREENGKKILFIEEIQSDLEKAVRLGDTNVRVPFTDSQSAYVGLAMKKVITYAVENGFDRVEWTTGSQQSERYKSSLVDNAEKIKYNPTTKQLSIVRPPEMSATSNWVDVGKIEQKNLSGMVGKDVARTLLKEPLKDGAHLIETENVEISDKGMVDFYDRLVPDVAAKMVKSIAGEKPVIEYEDPAPDSYDPGRQPGFDLDSIKATFEGSRPSLALFQEKKSEENRGAFQRGMDMTKDDNIILLLENADLSTYLHESAHFFYEQMRHLASLPNAPQQIKDDMRTLLEFVSEGELISLDAWNKMTMGERRDGHEKVARGFEAYLFEGKAPSVEIQSAFRRFAAWLKQIYATVKELDVKLTDEVRAVFDRMLATDLEIAKAREINRMRPLLENNDVIQMDPERWAAYQRLAAQDEGEADEKLRTRSMSNMKWGRLGTSRILAEKKRQIRPQREAMRDEVQSEVADQKNYKLISWLRQPVEKKDKIKSHKSEVTPEADSLFLAIGKLGGINKVDLKRSWGLDPATQFSKYKPAGKAKGGMDVDGMGILLEQYGYLPLGADGKFDPHVFEKKFFEELSGRTQYSNRNEQFEAAESYEDSYIEYARDNEDNIEGLENREHAKISIQSLIAEFGNEEDAIWKKLPKGRWGIVADNDQALDVDMVRALAGYGSVDEMIHALVKAEPMKDVIERETDQRMLESFGDLGDAASIERAVDEALHNEARTRMVHAELSALSNRVGKPNVMAKAAKEWAEDKIGKMRIVDIRPAEFAAQEARANRLAEKSLRQGNLEEATDHKRAAVLNHHFAKVASQALEEVDRNLRFFSRLDSKSARKAISPDYISEIDRLLGKYDLRKSVSIKEGKRRRVLKDWVEAETEKGNNPVVDPDLLGELDFQHYKQIPMDEFRGLYDTIKNIDHLGRTEQQIALGEEKANLDEAVHEMTMSIIKQRGRKKLKQKDQVLGLNNPQDKWVKEKAGYYADHRKIGNIFRVFDNFDDGGPFFRFVLKRMDAAADWQAAKQEEASKRLGAIFNLYSWHEFSTRVGKKENRLYRKEFIPEIPHKSGQMGINMSKMERLMVAVNWGNATNRSRLVEGFGITEAEIEASILSTLDDRDWTFVESIWEYYEEFWPLIAAKERRVTGVEPERVERMPFTTLSGRKMRGGYHPIAADEEQSSAAFDNLAKAAADQTKMGAAARATTRRGYVKARSEAPIGRPVKLSFDVIFGHVGEVIHDLSWHEWLIDVNKIIGHQSMRDTIVEHHGMQTYSAIKNTIIDIAAGDIQPTSQTEKRMNYFRQGVSIVYMGWNLGTSLLQPLGLTQSAVRIGPGYVGRAILKSFGSLAGINDAVKEMHEKSIFMRLRAKTMNREINEIRNKIGRTSMGSKIKDPLDNSFFYMIAKAQLLADVPTWLGAYDKAQAENASEPDSIARADRAVIDSQGSGHIKDLADVQRGGPLKKLWTNFMSYFQTTFNLTADSFTRTKFKSPSSVMHLGVDLLLLYSLPIVLEEYVRKALIQGECDDGRDFECMLTKIGLDHLAYGIGGILFAREFGGLVQGFADYDGPAGARVFKDVGQFANQVIQGEADEKFYLSALKAGGIAFHFPAGAMQKFITGYLDLQSGKTDKVTAPLFGYSKK